MKTQDQISPQDLFFTSPPALAIQSVLFCNTLDRLYRSLHSIARASELAISTKSIASVEILYGDCTPIPLFSEVELNAFVKLHYPHIKLSYYPFRENLGSAGGHNRLLPLSRADVVSIQNPDVVPAPDSIIELMKPFRHRGVGMVEARQIPIEHPKVYDTSTGETGWATTACAIVPRTLIESLNGFDADSFFLYCDDVDLSWRIRAAGFKIIFQPSAVIFHDKTLSPEGKWMPTSAERYYSAEASLMMAHKWSRDERVRLLLQNYGASDDPNLLKAAANYQKRADGGELCAPIDARHRVAEFTSDWNYTKHRFSL